jgi:hypothetical protein
VTVLALATLSDAAKNENDPICVVPPKVAKASGEGDIANIFAKNFTNVQVP